MGTRSQLREDLILSMIERDQSIQEQEMAVALLETAATSHPGRMQVIRTMQSAVDRLSFLRRYRNPKFYHATDKRSVDALKGIYNAINTPAFKKIIHGDEPQL